MFLALIFFLKKYIFLSKMPSEINPNSILLIAICSIAVTTIVSIYPALKASQNEYQQRHLNMNNIIELKNIVKNYNAKKKIKVLNKVNFSFKAGKIYSLMGPSGSGKSTLLNLLSLIDIPNSGTLKISNHTIDYS